MQSRSHCSQCWRKVFWKSAFGVTLRNIWTAFNSFESFSNRRPHNAVFRRGNSQETQGDRCRLYRGCTITMPWLLSHEAGRYRGATPLFEVRALLCNVLTHFLQHFQVIPPVDPDVPVTRNLLEVARVVVSLIRRVCVVWKGGQHFWRVSLHVFGNQLYLGRIWTYKLHWWLVVL